MIDILASSYLLCSSSRPEQPLMGSGVFTCDLLGATLPSLEVTMGIEPLAHSSSHHSEAADLKGMALGIPIGVQQK